MDDSPNKNNMCALEKQNQRFYVFLNI